AGSIFESARPSIGRAGSSTTAAATTGPASGPRPASSTPATNASGAVNASGSDNPSFIDRLLTVRFDEIENSFGGTLIGTALELPVNAGERIIPARIVRRAVEELLERGAEHLGPHVVLHELGNDAAAREQIRQREVRQLAHAQVPHEPIARPGHPVGDH